MAKLVDPDSLNQATEVVISTGAKTIQLLVAGNLADTNPGSTSGVTLQAVYSFLKEEWKTDAALNKFKFPIKMYTKTDGTLQNGWSWADAQTRQLIRDGGWTEVDGDLYAGIISLGSFDSSADQAYYQQVAGFGASTSNFDKTGNLNETIRIKDSGVYDYTNYLKVFLRIADGAGAGKLYSSYNLISEQGLSALEPVLYRLPLSNSTDLKINTTDATIDSATSPWQEIKIVYLKGAGFTQAAATTYSIGDVVRDGATPARWAFCTGAGTVVTPTNGYATFGGTSTWQAYDGEQQIGTNYYAFNRVLYLTSGTATARQIYNWAQRQLRKTSDINTGTTTNNATQGGYGAVKGNVAVDLLEYVGDTLKTKPGVLIRNYNINDQNSMVFRDITAGGGGLNSEGVPLTSTERTYPYVAAGTISFSSNLVSETDVNTKYTMYFTYITTTTGTDISLSGSAGSGTTLNWSGTTLDHLLNGDYISISGFTTTANNGIYLVGAVNTTANTAALTKQDSNNPEDEIAGDSVTVLERPFDSAGAIIVDNNSGADITGQITAASINFDFDYTNNTQEGRSGNTDAPVTVVAQGLPLAEWVSVTGTITQATGISIAVTANDERNYSNPA